MVNSDYRKISYSESYECENNTDDMLYGSDNELHLYNREENKFPESVTRLQPSDYQLLPKKFFTHETVPPPLVITSWLKLFYEEYSECSEESDESNTEDCVPLSDLKQKLTLACVNKTDSATSSPPVIQRKRGRPKKQNQATENDISDFTSNKLDVEQTEDTPDEDDADWWSKSIETSYGSTLEVETDQDKSNEDSDATNKAVGHFQEEEPKEKNKRKKSSNKIKKKNEEIHGIKVENSKIIFPCMECGKTFSAASTLKYHMRIHNGTLIRCAECDRGFTTNYLLKCHMRIHNGDLFMCHKCGRGFTTAELLKVHNRSHTGARPYRCDICGKSFPSASNLNQHKETHELEKKYLCFQCGSSFSQKRCLDGHMLSHGEKNHICTVCGKLWARKSDLTEHMRVHTGYKPYACNICHQKFTQASSLRRHQIVHTDANPIQCLTCGKMLKCDVYYKRHMKKHIKEKK